jgi:hypothetical protein
MFRSPTSALLVTPCPHGDRACESVQELWGRRHLGGRDRGEVEHDLVVVAYGGEPSTSGSESGNRFLAEDSCFPQPVGAGQRGVPAQRHLCHGREPSEQERAFLARSEERSLGLLQLVRDALHPGAVGKLVEQQHTCGVA